MKAFSGRTVVVATGLVAAVYCGYKGARIFVDAPSAETAVSAAAVMAVAGMAVQALVSLAMGWTTAGRCDDAPRARQLTRRRGSHVRAFDERTNGSRPHLRRTSTERLARRGVYAPFGTASHARRPAAHGPRR